ncbi:MAG: hypothetical protein A9Z00_11725 [Thermobacillus sp. ZCTH02-B1]|uniref:hypothetical protein n=1 Tax=Thermobacillus sp. ZCTH02-B1 TaxID=1858795 RepID=UPI000B5865E8|nr:hypothetical protein [Thermobacillus sp. ZCTH02-B1]OUM95824.1 MAG: hypothetical protein A9Z00_11725 [Thermobacillus sp. ZCTH02-B1]
METDLYAIIHLDAAMDKTAVARAVAGIAGGLAAGETVVTEWAEMLVTDGEEFAGLESGGSEDADRTFRHYRYCLEIEPLGNVDALVFKANVASLLAELREAGFRAAVGSAAEPRDESEA